MTEREELENIANHCRNAIANKSALSVAPRALKVLLPAIEAHLASNPAVSAEPDDLWHWIAAVSEAGFDCGMHDESPAEGGIVSYQLLLNASQVAKQGLADYIHKHYATPTVAGQDATVRDAALEEAAQAVESSTDRSGINPDGRGWRQRLGKNDYAAVIRAMKAKP